MRHKSTPEAAIRSPAAFAQSKPSLELELGLSVATQLITEKYQLQTDLQLKKSKLQLFLQLHDTQTAMQIRWLWT
jgi:hypothetical protein